METREASAVLVLVAIHAEVLPVGAVGRIVRVITVLMMHCQKVSVAIREIPAALGADEPVDFEGAFTVVARREPGVTDLLDQRFDGRFAVGWRRLKSPTPTASMTHAGLPLGISLLPRAETSATRRLAGSGKDPYYDTTVHVLRRGLMAEQP